MQQLPPPRYRTKEQKEQARRADNSRRQQVALLTKMTGKRPPAITRRKFETRIPKPYTKASSAEQDNQKRTLARIRERQREEMQAKLAGKDSKAKSASKAKPVSKPKPGSGYESSDSGVSVPEAKEDRKEKIRIPRKKVRVEVKKTAQKDDDSEKSEKMSASKGGGINDMLLPLMLMRGGLGGNQQNESEIRALHQQNEKDKKAAEEAIEKMKGLMKTLEELKETVRTEHEQLERMNEKKGCKCPDNSKIESKISAISEKLEESDIVEALEKCRKTVIKYKEHLDNLHKYSIYLENLTIKIGRKLKYNIKKTKNMCSRKKTKIKKK